MTVYIEKQIVIDVVMKMVELNRSDQFGGELFHWTGVKAILECIPAADVKPVVRGRWVKKDENPLDGTFYCSNCKGEIDIADGYITPLDIGLYYCHNCGADLREADNGKET